MKDKSILCLPQKYCCGCSSCFSICPVGAIQMTYFNGFLYPVVNKQICTNCGLCSEACQISIKHKNTKQNILLVNRKIYEKGLTNSPYHDIIKVQIRKELINMARPPP